MAISSWPPASAGRRSATTRRTCPPIRSWRCSARRTSSSASSMLSRAQAGDREARRVFDLRHPHLLGAGEAHGDRRRRGAGRGDDLRRDEDPRLLHRPDREGLREAALAGGRASEGRADLDGRPRRRSGHAQPSRLDRLVQGIARRRPGHDIPSEGADAQEEKADWRTICSWRASR